MKKAFFIYVMFLVLLTTLIMLRLQSLSFPREGTGHTQVIHLDRFHDLGHIFAIYAEKGAFFLKPFFHGILINGKKAGATVQLRNNDTIAVDSKTFIFRLFPGDTEFKTVFLRPLREILPDESWEIYLGGRPGKRDHRRKREPMDLRFLKTLAVEISPEILRKLIPAGTRFDGKLLVIRRSETGISKTGTLPGDPVEAVQVCSPHLKMTRSRNLRHLPVAAGMPVNVNSGDVFQFLNSENRTELSLKFDFQRVKSRLFVGERGKEKLVARDITNMIISYLEKKTEDPDRRPYLAYLKSVESGQYFYLENNKNNLFMGDRGLFRFNLRPDQLVSRRYIPESVYEGGVMDLKELLDRDLVYRQRTRFLPVDPVFLQKIRNLSRQGIAAVNAYLSRDHIQWRDFADLSDLKRFLNQSEKILVKMIRKGSWNRLCRALKAFNDRFALKGVGIAGSGMPSYRVYCRSGDRPWKQARPWENDTPLVDGISNFYWGESVDESNDIRFRFDFSQAPERISLIAVGNYAFSLDGRQYFNRSFFDGVQDIVFKPGDRRLEIRINGYPRFSREMAQAGLQIRVDLNSGKDRFMGIRSDGTWESSFDLVDWKPVKINRFPVYGQPELEKTMSIWYPEEWNSFYRGSKTRYFRKTFKLEFIPERVSWEIGFLGTYLFWINNHPVGSGSEWREALKRGNNTLMVMVSKKGCLKKKPAGRLLSMANNRLFLNTSQSRRSGLVRGKREKRPLVLDRKSRILAFNSTVNGYERRFFSPVARSELQSIMGSDPVASWGVEQIFSQFPAGIKVSEIQLTVDREWQKVAVEKIRETLEDNKKRESASPRYLRLTRELLQAQQDLDRARVELSEQKRGIVHLAMENIIRLQERLENLKTEINQIKNYFYEASVVILNSRGQVLVAAGYPHDQTGMEDLNDELRMPYRPYEIPPLNRAWKWKYNPGSTAKILDAISFLHSASLPVGSGGRHPFPDIRRLLDPQENFTGFPRSELKGSRMLNGKQVLFQLQNFRGHDIPPGFCSLEQALTHSYNTYFGYVALHNHRMLTEDSRAFRKEHDFVSKSYIPVNLAYREFPLLDFAERLGLNRKIDLLDNLAGTPVSTGLNRRPNDALFASESVFPINAYSPSDIAYLSIGQSDFQLTTLQNALIVSTIFNRGYLFPPSIIKSVRFRENDRPDENLAVDPGKNRRRIFSGEIAESIKKSLQKVVEQGTAAGIFDAELRQGRVFFAKTGTAETKFYPDNSLFVGFAEFRNGERIVFSATVPRSGTGAAVAGRLVARIMKAIILMENRDGHGW